MSFTLTVTVTKPDQLQKRVEAERDRLLKAYLDAGPPVPDDAQQRIKALQDRAAPAAEDDRVYQEITREVPPLLEAARALVAGPATVTLAARAGARTVTVEPR